MEDKSLPLQLCIEKARLNEGRRRRRLADAQRRQSAGFSQLSTNFGRRRDRSASFVVFEDVKQKGQRWKENKGAHN
jgi:hypothetical protein